MNRSRSAVALALSLALATSASAQAPAQAPSPSPGQTILVYSFGFSPSPLHLAAGRPVTLTFVNRAGTGHDFNAKAFFAASRILSGDARGGEVELRAHETRVVTLIPAAGTYKAHCDHLFHAAMGMTDRIVVN